MFSGIVEEVGIANSLKRDSGILKLSVEAKKVIEGTKIGDSISVNGTCLTVVDIGSKLLKFEVMDETVKVTNLQFLKLRDKLNLERSLKVGDRISGHFVTGHIDCLGTCKRKIARQNNINLEIFVPAAFTKYLIPKGSIAINGISLTIAKVRGNNLSVNIIPHTWKETNLSVSKIAGKLNLEFDILLKKENSNITI